MRTCIPARALAQCHVMRCCAASLQRSRLSPRSGGRCAAAHHCVHAARAPQPSAGSAAMHQHALHNTQIQTSLSAVYAPPASPVLTTPRGSTSSTLHSCSAAGRCSTPLGHHVHLPGRQRHHAVAKFDGHVAVQHDEHLVRVRMPMPHERTLQLDQLELVVVHFRDDTRGPVLRQQGELVAQIDRGVARVQRKHPCAGNALASLVHRIAGSHRCINAVHCSRARRTAQAVCPTR